MLMIRRKAGEWIEIEGVGGILVKELTRSTVVIGLELEKDFKVSRKGNKNGVNRDAEIQKKYLRSIGHEQNHRIKN